MKASLHWLLCIFLVGKLAAANASDNFEDTVLRKAIQAYQVQPHNPVDRKFGAKEKLGQALFFDPFVSGPKKIACAACHVRSKGAGDGIRLAVGLGAEGVSTERLAAKEAFIVPRNALPFFNRGSTDFRAFFWDGRVQFGPNDQMESPLGKRLPPGFENLLAVAAVFPPAEPDEMLGRSRQRSSRETYHAELVTLRGDSENLQERTLNVFENLVARLLGTKVATPNATSLMYRKLFAAAYPGTPIEKIGISHVGNALSAYIAAAFELKPAPWDIYVRGDKSALSLAQKKGGVIFFGKGRCVVCHSGTQFSDFQFHGLALPQLRVGKHSSYIDYGRAAATSRGEDRFAFRTPPLRNVVKTGPWGHNGIFTSIEAAISHHINPVPLLYEAQRQVPAEASHAGRLLGFRSTLLAEIAPLSAEDIQLLTQYLGSLSSETVLPDSVALPKTVPSGHREFIRQ